MTAALTQTIASLFDNCVPEPNSGCWLWLGSLGIADYGYVSHEHRRWRAHRLMWTLCHGYEPARHMEVCHKCDVTCCINPDHLFLGTRVDNAMDMVRKGRNKHGLVPGVLHGRSVLTEDVVKQIIEYPECFGVTVILAEKFGVDRTQVSKIRRGKAWKHMRAALSQECL